MSTQGKYRIRNWKEYNKSLIQRGSITVWLSEDAVEKWFAHRAEGKKGHPCVYSDDAILTSLLIRAVFHLPLRALQGFLISLVMLMKISLPIPCYTQICRRAKALGEELRKLSTKKITDLVIDSTGLKVYGEGEWKVRQHGHSKRRSWMKLHLAVCPDSHEIVFEILSENSIADCTIYPEFIKKAPKTMKRTYADGAYDTSGCYKANAEHGSIPIICPQRKAVLRREEGPHMDMRNTALLEITGLGGGENGRRLWKKLRRYHRRSLGETAMFRFKQLFGNNLRSRSLKGQKAEAYTKSHALNIMTRLGMPRGEWVA